MAGTGGSGPRWGRVLLTALTAVSWAFMGMAGVAALGLHLLGADSAGSLGPMTAAVVALAVGGSVSPSGNIDVFGISPGSAQGGFDIMPLGVGLAGALLLAGVFLRALRRANPVTAGELAARVGCTVVLFLGVLAGLAWAGSDTVAIDGASFGGDGGGTGDLLPGDLPFGDLPGLGDLARTKTSVGFHTGTGQTLAGGLVWVLVVLLTALLASRRTPLPRGWEALHRVVRPPVSALCAVLLVAVAAGAVAGVVSAVTGDEPGRAVGGVLLGAPNGVWLAVPLGLFVTWSGTARGQLVQALPSPLDELLSGRADEPITLGRLAELDGRVWLLPVAVGLMMLTAGVLTAARTPPGAEGPRTGRQAGATAVRLGVVTALAVPLLVRLTAVKVDADLSVFGFDAVGAGLDLHGSVPLAFLSGAVYGAGAGFAGALLASAAGVTGRRAATVAGPPVGGPVPAGAAGAAGPGAGGGPGGPGAGPGAGTGPGSGAGPGPGRYGTGPYRPSPAYRPVGDARDPSPGAEANPYRDAPGPAAPGHPAYRPDRAAPGGPDTPNPYRDDPAPYNPYKDPRGGQAGPHGSG